MDTKSIWRDSIKGQDDGGAVESLAFVGDSNIVATSLLKSLIESSMAWQFMKDYSQTSLTSGPMQSFSSFY